MRRLSIGVFLAVAGLAASGVALAADPPPPLGLPPVPVPADNPQTPAKIALGKKLFEDPRFSATGKVSCSTCHDATKAFTDSPLATSTGIEDKKGTRNAPTVINAAYLRTQFWDGRSPSLEDQSLHPFLNPVEMGLKDHAPILAIVRTDPAYASAFREVFGLRGDAVTMDHVTKAIAAFERTIVAGDSPFDRWYFRGDATALTEAQKRGFDVFVNQGRCLSCHVVEQTTALFTDNRFHNIGQGINALGREADPLAREFLKAGLTLAEVDVRVLSDARASELGRLAITRQFTDIGAFKTPTLRNVAVTAPYMHDGGLQTLNDVVVHYNNGGVNLEGDPVNDYLSGGIRPLGLTKEQIADLVAFLEALTSPEFQPTPGTARAGR